MSSEIRRLLIDEIKKRIGPLEATPLDMEAATMVAVSLRGSAGMAGETNLAYALTRLEPRLRAGETATIESMLLLLRRAVTRLEDGKSAAGGSWPVPPVELEPTFVETYVRGPYEAETKDRLAGLDQCLAAIDDPIEAAQIAFRHIHTLKGAASAVGDEPMSWFCHGLEERLRDIRDDASARAALVDLAQYRSVLGGLAEDPAATLKKMRGEIEVGPRLSSRPAPKKFASFRPDPETEDATVRVDAEVIETILARLDDLGPMRERIARSSRRTRELSRRARSQTNSPPLAEELEGLAAELRDTGDGIGTTLLTTKRLLSGLLLTSLSTVFDRIASVLDGEAKRIHREIRVRTVGGDEPIDRRIAERLVEPCMQIARNAVAHGIEPPAARRGEGKDPVGTITLAAKRTGDKLEIRIVDDGAGVDLSSVREHAVKAGIISAERAGAADDPYLLSLLLRPGFSTHDAPDLTAGRGIGLDIALHGIQRLGGTLRIMSRRGQGFTVRMELPVAHSGLAAAAEITKGRPVQAATSAPESSRRKANPPHLQPGSQEDPPPVAPSAPTSPSPVSAAASPPIQPSLTPAWWSALGGSGAPKEPSLSLLEMSESDFDRAATIALENASQSDQRDLSTRRSAAITRFREETTRPFARVRVAKLEDDVVGYLVTWTVVDEVHVLDVAVKESARRRGIGRALMAELIDFAQRHALQRIRHLLLEVRRSNVAALALYRSFGFFATNIRKRYYDDGEDAVEMRLELDATTSEVLRRTDEIEVEKI